MFSYEDLSDEAPKNSNDECEDSDSTNEFPRDGFACPIHRCGKSSNRKEYVTRICTSSISDPDVAIALSDGTFEVLTMRDGQVDYSSELNCSSNKHIVELKFDQFNNNLLWVADQNGIISLWDIRNPDKPSITFTDTTDEKEDKDKQFNSFDVSSCGRILCAGTDKFQDDSYILFWDIRKQKLAGGFWESHIDDITQVKFHPSESSKLFSGSTDGLINVYDLNHSCEEDSLVDTLNTEFSIDKICCGNKDVISCISHTADMQFWKIEDVQPYAIFSRENITELLQRKSETYSYIVDVHKMEDSFLVVAGATENEGKRVRVSRLEGKKLQPLFGLYKNKQRVLCSSYNEKAKLLVTGGEKGIVDTWGFNVN